MIEYAVYMIMPVLLVLIVVYKFVEKARESEHESKKQELGDKVTTIRANFKSVLNQLVADEFISQQQADVLYMIANHYFVFQPISDASVQKLKLTVEQVVVALRSKQQQILTEDDKSTVNGQLGKFLQNIPTSGGQFNQQFFERRLPEAIQRFSLEAV